MRTSPDTSQADAGGPWHTGELTGIHVLLAVTGSIAAYKAVVVLRELQRRGATVRVAMTAAATRFVAPLTFATLSGRSVLMTEAAGEEGEIAHVEGGREADVVLLCPATANTVAKLAAGIADDLLTSLLLAVRPPVIVCPAMNPRMWDHPATRRNLEQLAADGHVIVAPERGAMACGDIGEGRLAEPGRIVDAVARQARAGLLAGRRLLISAGATREHLDGVRFLSNPSTGRMGFALAAAGRALGATVTVVHGPTAVEPPAGVEAVAVVSAAQMLEALQARVADCDLLVMAAAVGDLRFARTFVGKLPKGELPHELTVEETPDLLATLAAGKRPGQLFIGFAAETGDVEARGLAKLHRKGMDYVVVNDVARPGIGFASRDNAVVVLDGAGGRWPLPRADKLAIARQVLTLVAEQSRLGSGRIAGASA
jgi:phosphopantothenoylcysteine decarboxylase/phosphopantothenate--cysteine ligase